MIRGVRVPKGMLMVNAAIAALAVFLAVWLVRDLSRIRPIPPPGAARAAQARATEEGETRSPAADERLGVYNVIPAKYLFNPQRSEGAPAAAAVVAPLPPKPLLHGVIVDGGCHEDKGEREEYQAHAPAPPTLALRSSGLESCCDVVVSTRRHGASPARAPADAPVSSWSPSTGDLFPEWWSTPMLVSSLLVIRER